MNRGETVKRAVTILVAGGATLKAVHITLNDDWDSVLYSLKKSYKTLFDFDILKDVKPNYDKQKSKLPKVVILGTGWGAMSFLQNLDQDDVEITIVSPRSFFFYTPLLAGTAVGTVRNTSIMEPIRWYFNRSGHSNASFVQASCSKINVEKKVVYGVDVRGAEVEIDYDFLIVAVGAEPATFNIPGVHENAFFMKEVDDGVKVQKRILERLEAASAILSARQREDVHNQDPDPSKKEGLEEYATLTPAQRVIVNNRKAKTSADKAADEAEISRLLHWVVVGAGPTGVELCAEMSDFVKQDVSHYFPLLTKRVKITLVEASDRILGAFDERMSKYALATLKDRGVQIQCASAVTQITPEHVEMKVRAAPTLSQDGKTVPPAEPFSQVTMPYGSLVWAGGITSRPITKAIAAEIGPEQTSRFGLEVDKKLRVKGAPEGSVWALGDCAVSGCAPTAQSASQQGKYLGSLFRDTKMDKEAIEAHPDFQFINKGSLAYLGDGKGVAEIRGLWDHYPTDVGGKVTGQVIQGQTAFVIWKSLYFSKLLSGRNQAQVAFDWISTSLFGRDISTTHNIDTANKEVSKDINIKKK